MTRDGGIQSLSEPGRFAMVKHCLFSPESPVWKTTIRDDLLGLIRKSRENSAIFVNVRDLFNLLIQGLRLGIDSVGSQDIAAVLSDRVFVQCLWESVTSRGIQYRMQINFIRARQSLIQNGTPEDLVPLTDELKMRLKEEESRASSQVPGIAGAAPMISAVAPHNTPKSE